jgi:hypothetical protein|tara:strand:- start:4406 stop:4843 length:438 start_codon:yes stop_codon:yes gene_type:complete
MAITTAMCTSFKSELLGGLHDLDTDSLKIALIKASPSGTYGVATTNYSNVTGNSDEASGTNYSAGGQVLDSAAITVSGTTALVDFADEVFADVTVSADGCIIYNTANSNSAIAVIDFGGTVSATAGDLTIEFPAADASNAVIRIA